MKAQLNAVFERMASACASVGWTRRPVSEGCSLHGRDFASMTDKLSVQTVSRLLRARKGNLPFCSCVCAQDGTPTGLAFHGVPLAVTASSLLYLEPQCRRSGQPIGDEDKASTAAIESTHLQVLVGFSLYHVPRRCCSCSAYCCG